MLRLLALFALAVVFWLMLETGAAFVRGRLTGRRPASRMPRPRPAQTAGLDLVRCARCGVHVPSQRALRAGGATYCGEDCRLAAQGAVAEHASGSSGQG